MDDQQGTYSFSVILVRVVEVTLNLFGKWCFNKVINKKEIIARRQPLLSVPIRLLCEDSPFF